MQKKISRVEKMDEYSENHDEDQQKKKKEEIKKISLARTPMQKFSPIMGEIERITKTAFIRKQALNERDRTNLKKTIDQIISDIPH